MTFQDAAQLILKATGPEDLFHGNPKATFRKLALLCHPDTQKLKADNELATEATKRLTELWALFNGDAGPSRTPTIQFGKWTTTGLVASGDVCEVYQTSEDGELLKVPRSEADNDLMKAEAEALKAIHANCAQPYQLKYFPTIIHSTKVKGVRLNGIRQVVDAIPLDRLVAEYDITFRHVVWMMNRVLTAMGTAHLAGYCHGAIIPPHMLYLPEDHGMVLIDWTASSKLGDDSTTPYISPAWESLYPVETKRKVTFPGTDIYTAVKSILSQINGKVVVPGRFLPLFQLATLPSPHSRPDNPFQFQQQWKAAAEKEYGPAKFVTLERK